MHIMLRNMYSSSPSSIILEVVMLSWCPETYKIRMAYSLSDSGVMDDDKRDVEMEGYERVREDKCVCVLCV